MLNERQKWAYFILLIRDHKSRASTHRLLVPFVIFQHSLALLVFVVYSTLTAFGPAVANGGHLFYYFFYYLSRFAFACAS